jgi:hypothetical protein
MGQILGLGVTHYPSLTAQGNLCRRIKMCLADPALPEHLRSLDNWPEPMRRQWAADDGQAHSDAHRQAMIDGFRMARRALDEFRPDFCVIWGDDQFENYREDCVPPFSVLAYDAVEFQPWLHNQRGVNSWNERRRKVFRFVGTARAASISRRSCSTKASTSPTRTSRCTPAWVTRLSIPCCFSTGTARGFRIRSCRLRPTLTAAT